MNISEPLLKVGTFGVHIVVKPSGHYGFAGTVSNDLRKVATVTYEESFEKFVKWFLSLSNDDQSKHYLNLREDVKIQLV